MLGGQPVQVGDNLRGPAHPQRRVRPALGGHQAQFLQPGRFQVGPRHAAELLEGRTAPGRQRGREPVVHCDGVVQLGGLMYLVLEGPGVNRVLAELYRVSRRGGDQDS